jgi:hypothetical protein
MTVFGRPKARAVCGLMIPAIAHTVWEKTVAFTEAANEPEDLAPAVGIAAMNTRIVGEGSQYMVMIVDSRGDVLDGGKAYKLHLPPNIPVKDFWSVIAYDNQTRSMVQSDQKFPSVSSQTKGLKVNADGSVAVYFGPKAPAGEENNWAQTIPGRSWNILLRLYGPLEPFYNKTWRPGEIEPLK